MPENGLKRERGKQGLVKESSISLLLQVCSLKNSMNNNNNINNDNGNNSDNSSNNYTETLNVIAIEHK